MSHDFRLPRTLPQVGAGSEVEGPRLFGAASRTVQSLPAEPCGLGRPVRTILNAYLPFFRNHSQLLLNGDKSFHHEQVETVSASISPVYVTCSKSIQMHDTACHVYVACTGSSEVTRCREVTSARYGW